MTKNMIQTQPMGGQPTSYTPLTLPHLPDPAATLSGIAHRSADDSPFLHASVDQLFRNVTEHDVPDPIVPVPQQDTVSGMGLQQSQSMSAQSHQAAMDLVGLSTIPPSLSTQGSNSVHVPLPRLSGLELQQSQSISGQSHQAGIDLAKQPIFPPTLPEQATNTMHVSCPSLSGFQAVHDATQVHAMMNNTESMGSHPVLFGQQSTSLSEPSLCYSLLQIRDRVTKQGQEGNISTWQIHLPSKCKIHIPPAPYLRVVRLVKFSQRTSAQAGPTLLNPFLLQYVLPHRPLELQMPAHMTPPLQMLIQLDPA